MKTHQEKTIDGLRIISAKLSEAEKELLGVDGRNQKNNHTNDAFKFIYEAQAQITDMIGKLNAGQ